MSDISKINVGGAAYDIKDSAARSNILSLNSRVTALENTIVSPNQRRFILMADSYGTYTGTDGVWRSWTKQAVDSLENKWGSDNVFNISQGSRGFVYNPLVGTFLTGLQAAVTGGTITNPETITDIIVAAGTNDVSGVLANECTTDDIKNAISAFVAYCKTTFPAATVKIGCIGAYVGQANRSALNGVRKAYRACVNYGAEYLTNSEWILDGQQFIDSSGIHPTPDGFDALYYYMNNVVQDGSIDVKYPEYKPAYDSLGTAFTSASTTTPLSLVQNNNEFRVGFTAPFWGVTYASGSRPTINGFIGGSGVTLFKFTSYDLPPYAFYMRQTLIKLSLAAGEAYAVGTPYWDPVNKEFKLSSSINVISLPAGATMNDSIYSISFSMTPWTATDFDGYL